METKDTLSSCSDFGEQEIQQQQKQAKILKKNSFNTFNALKKTTQRLKRQTFTNCPLFQRVFSHLFHTDIRTFKYELSQNMNNLEKQLNNEILYEKDSKSALSVIKVQFDKFIHSKMLKSSNYDSDARKARQDNKDYTQMEAQSFNNLIIQHMESIEHCIVERARHEQELQNRLKRLSERKLQIQVCVVQKVKATDASSGDTNCSGILPDKWNDQGLENQSNTFGDESSKSRNECNDKITSGDDTNIRPSYDTEPMVEVPYTTKYNVFVVDTQHSKQPQWITNTCVVEKVDSNVIPDSPDMCDNEIQTDQNPVECDNKRVVLANLIANLKLDVDENKKIQNQLKKANTSLARELKECKSIFAQISRTLGESNSIQDSCLISLQNKQTELETYKTLNDHTVDYDKLEHKLNETLGLLAQKEIDIKEGLKLKADEISVVKEKHDELVKQSLLTKSHYEGLVKEKTKVIMDLKLKEEKDIDKMILMEKQLMVAPKGPTFNGRPTFTNPMYLKKAQSEKPCLYEIPYDKSDPANRLVPDREETPTLEKESRSKLNKDKELVDQAWEKHSHNHFRAPTAHDMEILIKTCLMPLALKTQNDSFTFIHELKQEMHADLKYVESFEKEIDELKSDKAEFSNMYDLLLQECVLKDVTCSYLYSLSKIHAHAELKCLYDHKVKECECLAQKLSKQTETVSKEFYNELSRSFAKLEKHSISLKLALQHCKEQMINDKAFKETASNVFQKEQSLSKPVTPHSWPQVRKSSFAKPYDVNAPGPSRNNPKHVSFQSPKESVGSNDMVHNYYLEEAKKKAQL
uniref:Uncharacterized protein n=1 Tax=Tanacetum cinerariifolium TaxID=118510 RepID=A0A6L2JHZ0_TANCI|nr:hypothetical protein [Tanacetum cinerariifolium]